MNREQFNASVRSCRECQARKAAGNHTYCGYHTAVNAQLAVDWGKEQIRATLAATPADQLPSWAPAFDRGIQILPLETLLAMSIPFVQARKNVA